MSGIDNVLAGTTPESPFGFLYKIITTSVTFAAGGIGGVVTPIFFIGAQAGGMLADFLAVDTTTLAALGLVAVLAGTANTPLSASIMAIELFGAEIAPYATIACVISFLVTGQQSIYPSQRLAFDKSGQMDLSADKGFSVAEKKIPTRKGLFKKTLKDMVKHLIPNPKDFDNEK